MINFTQAYHFNKQNAASLKEVCQPLQNNFNFNLLTYRRFYLNGKVLYLFNNDCWLDFVADQGIWVTPNFKQQINSINHRKSIYSLWGEYYPQKDKKYDGMYHLNIWNGISVYKKREDFIEVYAFASTREMPQITNFYIQNHHIIEHFMSYFFSKINLLFKNIDSKVLLPFSIEPLISSPLDNDLLEKFLKETPINKFYLNQHNPLTQREMTCLIKTIKGKTAKEIGKDFNISSRSIEKHLDNIKIKMKCNSRREMIEKIFNNDEMKHLLF
jgi:DNA-binding CsgD family transcriptional regulator